MLDYGWSFGDRNRDLYLSLSVALYAPVFVIERRNSLEFLRTAFCFQLYINRVRVTAAVSRYQQSDTPNYCYHRHYYFYHKCYLQSRCFNFTNIFHVASLDVVKKSMEYSGLCRSFLIIWRTSKIAHFLSLCVKVYEVPNWLGWRVSVSVHML
jgi:hypothetical protein